MKRSPLLLLLASLLFFFACDEDLNPEIRLFEKEYVIGADGGELIIRFAANVDVTASSNVTWITVMDLGEMDCLVSVDPNPGSTERTGKVVFANYENRITSSVFISQAAGEAVSVESSELEFDYKSQAFSVKVNSMITPEVQVSSDWIHHTGTTVSDICQEVSFTLDDNLGKEVREGTIRISAGKQEKNLSVRQMVTTYAPASKEEIEKSEKMGEEVANSVQAILSGTSDSTPATTIANEIEQLDDVVYAYADEEGENIRFMKRDSTFTTVVLHPEKYGIDPTKMGRSSSRKRAADFPKSGDNGVGHFAAKKVLLLLPFYSAYIVNGEDTEAGNITFNYKWLGEELSKAGIRMEYYLDEAADLSTFRGDFWAQFDLILVFTHGGSWTFTDSPNTVPPFTICTTGQDYQEYPDALDPKLFSKVETIVMKSGSWPRYVVTEGWFDATSKDVSLSSSIIVNASCHSIENPDFRELFMKRKKAIAYAGFDNTTGTVYAKGVLSSICRSFLRGMTVLRTMNYVERDPELQTKEIKRSADTYPGRLNWDIDLSKTREVLVDPTPFNLNGYPSGNQAILKWDVVHTTGTYRYTVLMDGEKEYSAGSNLTLSVPAGEPGWHDWQVRADLYIGQEKIDSYTSGQERYEVKETPYFTVTTGEPFLIMDDSATFDVTYQTNQNLHVFSGGVVYSSVRNEPDLEKAYCQYIYNSAQDNPFRVKVEPLNGGTTYYARAYVITGESASTPALQRTVQYGEVVTFETLPDPEYPTNASIEVENEYGQQISTVDFGNVDLGQTPSFKLYLWNKSMNYRNVKVKSVSEGFAVDMPAQELPPNYAAIAMITFRPTMAADYSGSVVFDLGEGFNPIEVKLHGTGVPLQAEFTFSADNLRFDEVEVGKRAHQTVVISNVGKQSGFITDVVLPEGFGSGFYQAFPLAPGKDYTLEIAFMPTEAKRYAGDVIVYTDTAESGFRIAVEGYGTIDTVPVTGVSLDKQEITLTVGDKHTLHATVLPSNATNKEVRWKSMDPSVATVENGVVTALKTGATTIVVTTEEGAHVAACKVNVFPVNGSHEGTGDDEWN